jgi:hypothetical protein
MRCDECRAVFAALDRLEISKLRAVRLDEACPACKCADVSVSEFSPGPIANPELLVRLLLAPQHMSKKRTPKAAALSDAETHGMSLFRDEHATDQHIITRAELLVYRARASNPKAGVFGVLRMVSGQVREYRHQQDTLQSYCIYDTGLPENPSHAEIFQRAANADPALCEDRRRELFGLVSANFIPVENFRDGILSHLAPP